MPPLKKPALGVPLPLSPHLIARNPDSKAVKKAIVLNAPPMKLLIDLPRLGPFAIAGKAAGTEDEAPRADPNHPVAGRRQARPALRAYVSKSRVTPLRASG